MKTIKIFIGGGVKLLHGDSDALRGYRNEVIDPVVSQLNAREFAEFLYVVKDYSDLTRNVVPESQQAVYNKFLVNEARIAIFIIDGNMGAITREEIDKAVASAKRSRHPIVYIYGKNVDDDSDLARYLNQEGIYYQHFYNNSDLTAKIKADIDHATKVISARQRSGMLLRGLLAALLAVVLAAGVYLLSDADREVVDDCTAQLYLMRYRDINIASVRMLFDDATLSQFRYEDSIDSTTDDPVVFPVYMADCDTPTPPFFRLNLHNNNRNTVVFIEAVLEIDDYRLTYTPSGNETHGKDVDLGDFHKIEINADTDEYLLKGFRQNVAYGETDDNYFFYIESESNCSFRMRIRARTQDGHYLYSNYVRVDYVGKLQPEQQCFAAE